MKYEGGVGEGGKGGKLDLITLAALSTGRNPGLSRQKHASANIYKHESTYRTFIILKKWINVECRGVGKGNRSRGSAVS
jgi:hypothetical protein